MTSSADTLDYYEQALLVELRGEVERRAHEPQRVRSPRFQPGPRSGVRRWAALGAAAASIAVVGVVATVSHPQAAFAVDTETDGDIVVTVTSLSDADGLERALAAHGIEARVDYSPEVSADSNDGRATPQEGTGDSAGTDSGGDGDGVPTAPFADGGPDCGSVQVEIKTDSVSFRLPADSADTDSVLMIQAAGAVEDLASISVNWDSPGCDQPAEPPTSK
ncbi:MAG: hypothetical protein QM655_03910 [Nocardioidaceae bacterium]